MENEFEKETLRDRLIVAGIEEIATHGVGHFSLRRVASACGISCAAPYRHFADKESFIREILLYIEKQWKLLRDEILRLFSADPLRALTEVSLAYVRFSVANPHYRRILREAGVPRADFAGEALSEFCKTKSEESAAALAYRLPALLYGTVTMLEGGELSNGEKGWREIRAAVEELLSRA